MNKVYIVQRGIYSTRIIRAFSSKKKAKKCMNDMILEKWTTRTMFNQVHDIEETYDEFVEMARRDYELLELAVE